MKKKLYLIIILLIVVISTSGCVTDGLLGGKKTEKHTLTVKLINSSDELIKNENIEVTIDGEEGNYSNGLYTFNLTNGSYTVKASDPSNSYSTTSNTIMINDSDTITKLHLFKTSKSVVIKSLDKNNNILERTDITIEGEKRYKTEEGYQFALNVGQEYTVKISDPQDFYKTKEKTFTLDKGTDYINVSLDKRPTGTIKGKLYLPEEYKSAEIVYSYISYYDKEITSDKTGYKMTLPEGERKITVNTLFEGTVTKTINVKAGETVNKDIIVPLPENYPIEKFKEYKSSVNNVYSRWAKREIKYHIGFTDWVEDNVVEQNKEIYIKSINKGINIINNLLENVITYKQVDEPSNADVKIIVAYDSNSNLGGGKGILAEQNFDDREVIFSKIYISKDHVTSINVAHELGHSLAFNHSSDNDDLMYYNSNPNLENLKEGRTDDKKIMGLVYSLAFGTKNIFIK